LQVGQISTEHFVRGRGRRITTGNSHNRRIQSESFKEVRLEHSTSPLRANAKSFQKNDFWQGGQNHDTLGICFRALSIATTWLICQTFIRSPQERYPECAVTRAWTGSDQGWSPIPDVASREHFQSGPDLRIPITRTHLIQAFLKASQNLPLTNRPAKSDLAVAMFWPTVSVAAGFTSQELAGVVFCSISEGTRTGG
jgi:hypothetical protein